MKILVYTSLLLYTCTFEIWLLQQRVVFPVNCIVLKVVESSYSMLYQNESGGVGAGVTCRTEQSWESMRLYFLFYINLKIDIFLDIGTSFFDLKKSISWYQKIDSWYQEIVFIFLYQEIGLIFLYHWFFSYQEMDFLYQKSKYRMNSITAPQCAILLFIRYFFYFWYKKNINLSFWYTIKQKSQWKFF